MLALQKPLLGWHQLKTAVLGASFHRATPSAPQRSLPKGAFYLLPSQTSRDTSGSTTAPAVNTGQNTARSAPAAAPSASAASSPCFTPPLDAACVPAEIAVPPLQTHQGVGRDEQPTVERRSLARRRAAVEMGSQMLPSSHGASGVTSCSSPHSLEHVFSHATETKPKPSSFVLTDVLQGF